MKLSKLWAAGAFGASALALGYVGYSGALNSEAVAAEGQQQSGLLHRIDNFRLADQNFDSHELYRLADAKAIVIFVQGNGCPIVRNVLPALKELRQTYASQGVEFIMLNSNIQDTREAVLHEAAEYNFTDFPVLMDANQLVGEQLGVTRTAEVIVIDPKTWRVAYRGPIDDRVVYERQKAKADHAWAKDALDAMLAGKTPAVNNKEPMGCIVNFPERDKSEQFAKISYAKDVAPILEEKCVACHQSGGIGPMQLTSYENVKGFAPMIRETIRTQRMPPFHADPTVGKWHDDKSLSPKQIKTLVHWIEAGAPRGSGPDPLAMARREAPEWPLGKPDLVLKVPAFNIPATGVVDYQRPWVKNPLTEDRWLRASTVKVSQRQGVHHILTGYLKDVPTGPTSNESKWGASVGGYAVGAESMVAPKDVGTLVPAGGAIGFQNHYTPFGKEATDNSEIALYFYPKGQTPKMVMRSFNMADPTISIPANTPRHKEVAYLTFPKDALLYQAFPHAHYRGQASDLRIRYPDGKEKLLLTLPKYDFNWQRGYDFAEPVKIPAGSKLIATYTYDNTKRNPANPDPNRVVPWGDQSFDEMFFTALRYRWMDETSDKMVNYDDLLRQNQMFGMLDDNIDGKLQLAELKGDIGAQLRTAFAQIDANGDKGIDEKELAAAQASMQRNRRQASAQ